MNNLCPTSPYDLLISAWWTLSLLLKRSNFGIDTMKAINVIFFPPKDELSTLLNARESVTSKISYRCFPKSKHSFLLPPKEVPRKKRNLSNVQYIRTVKMQLALSTWVKFMLPGTRSSLLCRAIPNRLCLGRRRWHFRRRRTSFTPHYSVLMPDADVEVSPVLLHLWVTVVGTCLPILAQRA